jgi:prepilin-type N-terminal cleavage/methylation domain-containing protein
MTYIRNQSGFTIVELLVTMILSSLVVSFVYSLYFFSVKLMGTWERRVDLHLVIDQCFQRIDSDIMSTTNVVECNDSLLSLLANQMDTVKYRFTEMDVSRNGVLFASDYPTVRLNAGVHLFAQTATGSCWPSMIWSIRIKANSGRMKDSLLTTLSMLLSSQEIVDGNVCSTGSWPKPGTNKE